MTGSSKWRTAGLGLILLILAAGPYFRGLFFTENLLVAIALTGLGFAAWAYGRRQDREPLGLPGGPVGWALLALVGAYGLQFLWALYFRGNLDWFLRAATAWLLFVMIRAENHPQMGRRLGWILLVSQGLLAFLGMLQFVGFLPGLMRFLQIPFREEERLYSSYQYPNTAAAVFVTMVILALGMLVNEEEKRRRMALGSLIALLSATAFFTLSRGALLMVPLALVALLIGLRLRTAMDTLLAFILAGALPTAVVLAPLNHAGVTNTWPVGVMLILLVIALGAGAVRAVDFLRERLETKKMVVALAGVSVLAAVGLVGFVLRDGGAFFNTAAARLTDVNLETYSAMGRLQMYQDAISAVSDQPWGYGGSSWERLYRRYQPMYYTGRDTHSHLFQVVVETGIPGIIAWVLTLLLPLWITFRQRRDHPLRWAYLSAAGALAAHSLIDFNLSFLSVWLLLNTLLAAALPPPAPNPKEQKSRIWLVPTAGALGVAVLASVLASAAFYTREANKLIAAKQNQAAARALHTAISLDPWDSSLRRLVGSLESVQKAVELDPHNPAIWSTLSKVQEQRNDLAGAQTSARKLVDMTPARREVYEDYARLTGILLDAAMIEADKDGVLEQTRKLMELNQILAQRIELEKPYHEVSLSPLKVSHLLALEFGKAYYLTGNQEQALQHLTAASKHKETDEAASLWLHAILTKTQSKQTVPKPPSDATQRKPLYQGILKWTTP